jgi:hypothetical protein
MIELSPYQEINSFDFDGVINIPNGGVRPRPVDVIITGRCFSEYVMTKFLLMNAGMKNTLYTNHNVDKWHKTDEASSSHKINTILNLRKHSNIKIINHFEDNEIQAEIIKQKCPWVNIILLKHDLTSMTSDTNYM